MEIVFYKRITRSNFTLGGEGAVIFRCPIRPDSGLVEADIAAIAPQLYEEETGEPFQPENGVYYRVAYP